MIFDYETLKLIWWALIGVLLIGFAVTDGFDMGVGMLLPFLGKGDAERRWRSAWDWGLFAGSAVPALVFGVAFGNLLLGVPFRFDATMRSFYEGSFLALLNPFALLAGVLSVSMLVMHGAVYLQIRTSG